MMFLSGFLITGFSESCGFLTFNDQSNLFCLAITDGNASLFWYKFINFGQSIRDMGLEFLMLLTQDEFVS